MRKYIIYKHTSPSGKVYIGQTCKKPIERWNGGRGYKRSPHFYSAILKYGWDNIKHEIITTYLTKKEADWVEKYLIAYYHSTDNRYGYNITKGGEGSYGYRCSEEKKKKIGEANKGHIHTEETRNKMSISHKGMYLSDEIKQKISIANKGKIRTEESKERMSEAQKKWFLEHPERRIELSKIASERGKPVNQLDMDGNFIRTFKSAKDAAIAIGSHGTSITKCCMGKKGSHRNFKWEYANNNLVIEEGE